MFYQLPPAGSKITLSVNQASALPFYLTSEQTSFYQSGTAALAAAMLAAREQNNKRQNDKQQAEVILPAYGCPDLVSAAIYAGVKPVLVDLETNRPWYDLAMLEQAVTKNTVAIVGVNLFGLAERWPQLRKLADLHNIVLIEDSAQYFPGSGEKPNWQGDLVVFSFGRGKAVSLLGGGAVYCQQAKFKKLLPNVGHRPESMKQQLVFSLKVRIYNVLLSPYLYWLPLSLPFLHLGETRYHVLHDIDAMDQIRADILASNISCYQADAKAKGRCEKISTMLNSLNSVIDLPQVCAMKRNRRLLRYPILVVAAERDRIYGKLHQAGLGVSIMYPASLPEINGLNHIFDKDHNFPNAKSFASSLITLPIHSSVSDKDLDSMNILLSKCFANV